MSILERAKNYKVPEYQKWMNEDEKLENHKIISNMNKRINYTRNPRFKVDKTPVTFKRLIYDQKTLKDKEILTDVNCKETIFRANPAVIKFSHYMVNNIYRQELILTNSSNISRRIKILPPKTSQYSIDSIVYPMNNSLIAPGMSVIVAINFNATSMADFKDKIGVITEENSFFIPIISQKEAPIIKLNPIIECGSCWVGDQINTVIRIKNHGGSAGFRLFKYESEQQKRTIKIGQLDENGIDPHFQQLQLDNFLIQPAEFYIEKDEVQELFVNFKPNKEGNIEEKIIMAADNETNCIYSIQGKANTVEFQIDSLDEQHFILDGIDCSKDPFYNQKNVIENMKEIEFKCIPGQKHVRKLRIKNMAGVRVRYRWQIFTNDQTAANYDQNNIYRNSGEDEEDQCCFEMEPMDGHFEGNEVKEFEITYQGVSQLPSIRYANLIIEDIPFKAVKDPNNALKQHQSIPEYNSQNDHLLTNTKRPSISVYEIKLNGSNYKSDIICEPQFFMKQDILINKVQECRFRVKNHGIMDSKYKVFKVEMVDKLSLIKQDSCAANEQNQTKKINSIEVTEIVNSEGVVQKGTEVEVTIKYRSNSVQSKQICEFQIELEQQSDLYFSMVVDFRDANVSVKQSFIDFDLIKTNQLKKIKLNIENNDDIDTTCFFTSNDIDEKVGQQVFKLFEQGLKELPSIKVGKQNNLIEFSQQIINLQPREKKEIELSYISQEPETLQEYINFFTRNQKCQSLFVFAEVQNIHVTLNRFKIKYDCLFAGNTYKINRFSDNKVMIQNYGNIGTYFRWVQQENNEDEFSIKCNPSAGYINAKENIMMEIDLLIHKGGKFEYIMVIEIEGVEYAMGIEIEAEVKGLEVECYLIRDENQQEQGKYIAVSKTSKSQQDEFQSQSQNVRKSTNKSQKSKASRSSRVSRRSMLKLEGDLDNIKEFTYPKLNDVKFQCCEINKPQQQIFQIKNLSGIDTNFEIDFDNFFVKQDILLKQQEKQQQEQEIMNKYMMKQSQQFRFTSSSGKKLDYQKKLENDSKLYLTNDKGIAIICEPFKGGLKGYSSVNVTVTCFNDICGKFQDMMNVNVAGLAVMKYGADIIVKGSPLKIPINQVGLEFKKKQFPKIKFGTFIQNQGVKTKNIRLENSGPQEIIIDWKIFIIDNQENKKQYFKFKIDKQNPNSKYSVQWNSIEPEENDENLQFRIQPMSRKIQSRSEKSFKFEFRSNENIGDFNAVAVGKPYIKQTGEILEDLVVRLQASTRKPELVLEKRVIDDKQTIKLYKQINQDSESKIMTLFNNLGCNLEFKIDVFGPFKIVSHKTDSVLKSLIENYHNINDNNTLELKLIYIPSAEDKTEVVNRHYSQGSLDIVYSNGSKQTVYLEGQLLRPQIQLYSQGFQNFNEELFKNEKQVLTLDFGEIFIQNKKTLSLWISNCSKVSANIRIAHVKKKSGSSLMTDLKTTTKLEKEEQDTTDFPQVFEFNITEFNLNGPSIPLNKMPTTQALPNLVSCKDNLERGLYPQQVKVNFRPKLDVVYKSRFRVILQDGKPVDFYLKGKGTFKEEMDSTK